MAEVNLHGFWGSPFSHRVIWALKLKGVKYEYIEEDLPNNKSELLLQYNPVYKKIPVLVHGGKPIAESLVILEYIEETWPDNPLLPQDAYGRAMARFWIKFSIQASLISKFFRAITGDEKEKAASAVLEMLKILEEQGLGDRKFFGGETINLVDITYGFFAHWFLAMQEVVGIKVMETGKLPRLCAWAQNFKEVAVIKENLPDFDKLLDYMRCARKRIAAAD